ncbi:hypothetical protein A0J61_01736 [Choanephora cucurbitarum]|uniref:Uncharacterized protein n=1 Tax=Choanephora cucurbitarum TaxID=101091 RepID=A0A1C7NM46_9FUNG|nr:hypothetical protein A0J61_01736 [Choanephora cucurbitarum]
MDKILSLLKDQDIKTPQENPLAQLDLSKISQDVIEQVRDEYLARQRTEAVRNATSMTPEVLATISQMVKETHLLTLLKDCKARQDKKERELFTHRVAIQERYKKQRDSMMAKQLIGINVNERELQALDDEMTGELHAMDLQIIKEMDAEVTHLQKEFVRLQVPLFKVSQDPSDVKLQQKVLFILQDMI